MKRYIASFLIVGLVACTKTERITDTRMIIERDTVTVTDTIPTVVVDTILVLDTVYVGRGEFYFTVGNEWEPTVNYFLNNFTDLSYDISLTHVWVHVWDSAREFVNEWDDFDTVSLSPGEEGQYVSSGIFPPGVYRIEMRATFVRNGRSIDYYATWES